MKLYDLAAADDSKRFSPYCWRIKLALAHKGLQCDTIPWRFTDKDKLPSPNDGKVPVLVDGEVVISDSWEIAQYLESKYPAPPLFQSEESRAHALLIKFWFEQEMHPLFGAILINDIYSFLAQKDKDYFRISRENRFGASISSLIPKTDENVARLGYMLGPLRAMLERQSFVSGASPGFADYIVFSYFLWARISSKIEIVSSEDIIEDYVGNMMRVPWIESLVRGV